MKQGVIGGVALFSTILKFIVVRYILDGLLYIPHKPEQNENPTLAVYSRVVDVRHFIVLQGNHSLSILKAS